MPRTATRPSTVTTALFFLLAGILCANCRTPEPPVENNTAKNEAALTVPLATPQPPAAPGHINIDPGIVFKGPEIPATDDTVPPPRTSPSKDTRHPGEKTKRPRIAIIIDDMGYHQQLGRQFLELDLNLTYSFLPDAPYSGELATAAFQTGRDILVHLPMEPKDPAKHPGANALSVQDTPEIIRQKMAKMLSAIPHAIGANNHMGSRFTEDSGAMQVVINTLRNRSFFFTFKYRLDQYDTGYRKYAQ